jgi:UDP-3-O-[3-hydroxymyristoyl] glucosamine N-acyltransferase
MIDPRFYEITDGIAVGDLAVGAVIKGDAGRIVRGVAPASAAGAGDLCYVDGAKVALSAMAGVCIVTADHASRVEAAGARVIDARPRALFARLAAQSARPRRHDGDVAIHPNARLEENVRIGPKVVIGQDAHIGAGTVIAPGAVIGPGVAIGRRARIGPNAVIGFSLIGDDVSILAGAVIGEQGFGVASDAQGLIDAPHFARVIIQDRVTIGANTTVDRGMFEDTQIGEETKIDNLCHVAHGVTLGRRVVIAAFGGISGSTQVGEGVMMGGRVGIVDHRSIGDGAVLAAGSAVLQNVPAGETWCGYPAKPVRRFLREQAWLSRAAARARRDPD